MTKTAQTARSASKHVEVKRTRPAKRVEIRKTAKTAPVEAKRVNKNVAIAKRRVSKNVEIQPWREGSIRGQIVEMLSTKRGASLDALCDATGWSIATMRARVGGLKSRGYVVENIGERGAPVYRIA